MLLTLLCLQGQFPFHKGMGNPEANVPYLPLVIIRRNFRSERLKYLSGLSICGDMLGNAKTLKVAKFAEWIASRMGEWAHWETGKSFPQEQKSSARSMDMTQCANGPKRHLDIHSK